MCSRRLEGRVGSVGRAPDFWSDANLENRPQYSLVADEDVEKPTNQSRWLVLKDLITVFL